MAEWTNSPFFGVALSVVAFWIGVQLQKKTGLVACNPLLVAVILVIGVLLALHIPYENYDQGGSLINLFLSPATACLAVAIYSKVRLLKENWLPILVGCVVGSLVSGVGQAWGLLGNLTPPISQLLQGLFPLTHPSRDPQHPP